MEALWQGMTSLRIPRKGDMRLRWSAVVVDTSLRERYGGSEFLGNPFRPRPGPEKRHRTDEPGGELARQLLWDVSRGDAGLSCDRSMICALSFL